MLIDFVSKKIHVFKKKEKLIKGLLALASLFLFYNPILDYKLMSSEFHYPYMNLEYSDYISAYKEDDPMLPPNQSILIVLDTADQDFEFFIKSLDFLFPKSKSIKISDEDIKENYFIKIFLKKDHKTFLKINPLQNFQCNSDLVFVASKILGFKLNFSFNDLINNQFENSLHIHLNTKKEEMKKVLKLIRYFMNLDTLAYGLYFYVPLGTKIIKAERLILFNIITFLSCLYESELSPSPFYLIYITVLMFYLPILVFIQVKRRYLSFVIVLCLFINFKSCFLCSLFIQLKNLKKIFRSKNE